MDAYLGHYSSITILITTTVNKIISLGVHPPLTDDEIRILKILLAEHLDQLNENGVSLDLALSGGLVLSKQSVVECLHLIGQVRMLNILSNKQGKLSSSTTKPCTGYQSGMQAKIVAQGDNYHFSLFWHGSIRESFLHKKICFIASRTLYLLSYDSKKLAV